MQPLLAWWKGATRRARAVVRRRRAALALIAEKRVTTMMGVPANYLFMAQEPGFASADLSSLRRAVVGGAPMPEALLETWHERGVEIVQGYGLTEAAPNVLCLPPEDATRKRGFAGKPYPHVDVALRDPETRSARRGRGRRASSSCAARTSSPATGATPRRPPRRSPTAGCSRATSPRATRRATTASSAGLKDMVISRRRERLSGRDRERPARASRGRRRRRSSACPDERWGEACLAVRRPRGRRGAARTSCSRFCRERLARFKVPREVRFVDSLPRNALDKVAKSELLELVRIDEDR